MSNPYELRFKILEMARELCHLDYSVQENSYFTLLNSLDEQIRAGLNTGNPERFIAKLEEIKPVSPSPDVIKQKAAELYEFVERKPEQ